MLGSSAQTTATRHSPVPPTAHANVPLLARSAETAVLTKRPRLIGELRCDLAVSKHACADAPHHFLGRQPAIQHAASTQERRPRRCPQPPRVRLTAPTGPRHGATGGAQRNPWSAPRFSTLPRTGRGEEGGGIPTPETTQSNMHVSPNSIAQSTDPHRVPHHRCPRTTAGSIFRNSGADQAPRLTALMSVPKRTAISGPDSMSMQERHRTSLGGPIRRARDIAAIPTTAASPVLPGLGLDAIRNPRKLPPRIELPPDTSIWSASAEPNDGRPIHDEPSQRALESNGLRSSNHSLTPPDASSSPHGVVACGYAPMRKSSCVTPGTVSQSSPVLV